MQRTNIYLGEDQTAALDAVAIREGLSRAEVIRRLVDRGLAADAGSVHDDLLALDESFGVLAGDDTEDEVVQPATGDAPARANSARDAHLRAVWGR